MDGDVDVLSTARCAIEIQERGRRTILDPHGGDLLVGSAVVVESGDRDIPYLVAAPTVRVPMTLPEESTHAHLAARAVILLITKGTFPSGLRLGEQIGDQVKTVAFPGLGTGIGRMGVGTRAHQMRAAIEDIVLRGHAMPRAWVEASERHQHRYTTRLTRLQQAR